MKFYKHHKRIGEIDEGSLRWKDIIRILMCLELFWHFKSKFRYIINKIKLKTNWLLDDKNYWLSMNREIFFLFIIEVIFSL